MPLMDAEQLGLANSDRGPANQLPGETVCDRDDPPIPLSPTLFTFDFDDPTWIERIDELMEGFGEDHRRVRRDPSAGSDPK